MSAMALPAGELLWQLLGPSHHEPVSDGAAPDDVLESRAIEAVQGGDANAFDYLVSKYLRRVLSVAWTVVRDPHEAEELAQEAFVRAFESIDRFRKGQPFGPWIFRIVTNLALDVVKRRKRYKHEEVSELQAAPRSVEADLPAQSNEIARRIDAALESLPEMQRLVARLSLVEEFAHTEIAAMTNLSEGTVRSHLSLARKKLKEELADLYGADHE